jgi:hypothetical protein
LSQSVGDGGSLMCLMILDEHYVLFYEWHTIMGRKEVVGETLAHWSLFGNDGDGRSKVWTMVEGGSQVLVEEFE